MRRMVKCSLSLLLAVCLLPLTACSGEEKVSNVAKTTVTATQSVMGTASVTQMVTTSVSTQGETTTTTGAVSTTPSTTIRNSTTTTTETTLATQTTTTTQVRPTVPAVPEKEWELYWSDEFDGDSLDMTKWNIEGGSTGTVVKKKENVAVENGDCVITLRRDDSTPGYEYSSAYVTTAYKFSFCFGRLEFRAKLPVGQGVWPALWTLGDNYLEIGNDEKAWPLCGEIDVMELIGSSNPQNPFDSKKVMGTLHWGPNRDNHQQAHNSWILGESPADDYHIYAVEWNEDEIVWYVDNRVYLRVSMDDPTMGTAFMQKHWIIMNINLNGYDGYNKYDDTTPEEERMYVDYVRVYKEKR